ncbi:MULTISPECIES: MOP flippase family protein [unclassified Bradyrhizobium]|uniref:MOP flippase family protein n=1 Tax=unclassified Bradyrhizobium TaxID=2631580 RepID=UPI001FFB5CE3|nr:MULTISPECIES: MOP flippase family protein [unclassified Bradyrhizobium]MCK1317388.1 MOP flippase family protein [Bradyrhizobium sp. 23]MCK1510680.1 MOP flippase family protein [Bradyrhizobium sp. 18]MCK1630705.1 MOP flippase family protein [Bradyrhizobium sp. 162]MCK1694402.1 MOP flippase family protein [Bradyrhizobium sp. 144]
MKNPSSTAISNLRWVGVSQICRITISVGSMTIFARLLPADDFGLLAMATVVTNFAAILRDMGTAAALVQKHELSQDLIDTVFWSNVLFGLVTGGAVAASSPLWAFLFHVPRLETILLALSLSFPVAALGASHLALLEKRNNFRKVGFIEVSAGGIGALAGILFAAEGGGIWGLIVQTLVTAGISTVLLWTRADWQPTLRWSFREFKGLLRFSGNLVSFNVINYFARNADGFIIGRYLGASELGHYNVAYRLMLLPLSNLTFVVNRALFPIYSTDQSDPVSLGRKYVETLRLISLITAPLMLGLWAVRTPFIESLLGSRWLESATIIGWLAPVGYLQSMVSTTGALLAATGRTDILRNLGLANSAMFIASFALGLKGGAVGVAQAYFIANIIVATITLHVTLGQVRRTLADFLKSIMRPFGCAIAMMCVVALADAWLPIEIPPIIKLMCLVSTGVLAYCALLLVFQPTALGDASKLFGTATVKSQE